MINISDEQLTDYTGFTVYDAETGEPVEASEMVRFAVKAALWILKDSGELAIVYCDTWEDVNVDTIPKRGKYLIQFGSGKYMRW